MKNAPTLAIVAVDTAENEPSKVCPLSVYRSLRFLHFMSVWHVLDRYGTNCFGYTGKDRIELMK